MRGKSSKARIIRRVTPTRLPSRVKVLDTSDFSDSFEGSWYLQSDRNVFDHEGTQNNGRRDASLQRTCYSEYQSFRKDIESASKPHLTWKE